VAHEFCRASKTGNKRRDLKVIERKEGKAAR
jgi:hypothetical protein